MMDFIHQEAKEKADEIEAKVYILMALFVINLNDFVFC